MKRLICFALLLPLLLTGCSWSGSSSKNAVFFYYPRQNFQYAVSDGSMGKEARDLADRADDLNYIIHLYLLGPQDETLTAVYPKGIHLLSTELTDDNLLITLSSTENTLSDIQFTLAAACLARTCLGIAPVSSVTIRSGDHEITLTGANMLLMDESATLETGSDESLPRK